MSSVIATVQSIVGQVFAVSPDGARRLLVEGDRLFKGEEVLTGASGMVTLALADGRTLDLGRDSQWSESDTSVAAQDAQPSQQVVSPGDEVAQLQQAIEAGMDPTQTLEATAAGPSSAGGSSGGAGGGHSFVMLDATGEVLEATVGFETSGLGGFASSDEQTQEPLQNQAPEFLDENGAVQGPLNLQTAEDTPISGAFNTRDVNGDLVTLTVTRAPTNGTLIFNANGTWTYTPAQDYNGGDSFEVTATDGRGASTPLTVNLTVTPVNDAPVATGTYDATIDDSAAADTFADIKGQLAATDVDDTVLTWSGSAKGAYGELTVNPDGSYTYVVDAKAVNGLQDGEQASESFVVTVKDPSGASDTRVITINFNGANDTPIATASSAEVTEDQTVNGTLQASDADKGAVLSYELTGNAPAGFTLNAQTGEWTLDAGNAAYQALAEGQKLTLSVPFEVSDQFGAKTSSTLTITVTGVNDAAILGSANVQLTETNAPLSTSGTLSISDVDSPETFVAQSNIAGQYGSFSIDANGNWSYVANSAFNELNVGQSYSESFKVASADGTESSVTITINGSNDAAVLSSANVQLTETNAPLTANGTLTISDVDSPETFVAQNNVAGQYGTFSIDAAGNWSFVANSAFNELNVGQSYSESFDVESADGTKSSVTVTINGSNDRPVGVADNITLDEDTTATGNVLSNDTDADNASLSVTKFSLTALPFVSANAGETLNLGIGKLTIQANGDFTFVPAKDYNGPVPSVTYTLSDGSLTSTATLRFDINPVNDAPVNTAPGAQTLAEDGSKTFSVLNGNSIAVSDVDGDRLTTTLSVEHGVLTLGPLKNGITFSGNGTGSITLVGSQAAISLALQGLKYTPAKDYNGQDTLTINTTDGKLSDSDSVTLTITPVNDAPVATPTSESTSEDAPVIGGQLAASDVDGDTLTYSAQGALPGGFVLNGDGSWTLDPGHAAYQHLAEGKSTTLTINFTATDGTLSSSSTLTITVTGVNDTPVITAATAQANEGDGQISGQIDASDVDDGAVLSFTTSANIAGLTLGSDGQWTFDASNSAYDYLKAGEKLVLEVPVTVTDEHGASADSTLTITLTGTNDAPVANAVSASGNEDQAARIQVNLSGSDVDGNVTGFTLGSIPANGTLYASANGGAALKTGDNVTGPVYFVPNKDWNGTTTFEYSAVDNDGATSADKATATITVAPVNDRPVGVNDSISLDEDTTATGNVLSNDRDVDGDSLSVTKFSLTSLPFVSVNAGETLNLGIGKLTIQANGDFTFVPAKNYNGPVPSVTYTLSDGSLTSTATLTFNITPVNDAPVNTTPGAQTLAEDGSKTFSLLTGNSIAVSDVDGDRLTTTLSVEHGVLTLGPLKNGITFSGNGTGSITLSGSPAAISAALQGLKYVPAANYNGQDTLTISTSDGALSDTDSITLNITPVNDAPIAMPTAEATTEDAPAIGGQLAASDIDGDSLSFSLNSPAPAGFALNPNGSWTFDPSDAAYQSLGKDEVLVIQVPFTVTDGALSSSSTLTITITGVNDVPVVTGAISVGTDEDAAGQVIDLLVNASDADAKDVLSIVNLSETSGNDASGVSLQGNTLVIDPSKYNYLAVGESVTLVYEYQVSDGKGGLVNTSATITIDGVNDAPVVSSVIAEVTHEDASDFSVDLLANATDADSSDTLSISDLQLSGNPDASGVSLVGNNLQVNPNAYNYLAVGEKVVLTYSYNVIDGNGGITPTTATITIEGRNDAPVFDSSVQRATLAERADGVPNENTGNLTASGSIGFSDADLSNTHSVSTQLVSAKDGNDNDVSALGNLGALISDAATNDGQGTVQWNYSVAAGALDYLGAGETVTLVYRVTVTDSSGAETSRDVTITLTGSNDEPVVTGVATTLTNEDAPAYSLDLLQHASDEDANDVLSVGNLQLVGGGNDAGVTFDAASNSLKIDPSQYDYLAVGEKVVLDYSYEVSDGNGGVVNATASVTIEGRNDAPVVTDTSVTVAEESLGTPLNIAAPTDVDLSDVLTITVTGLPTVGTVTLANGTPVNNGQTLTSAELQGLKYNGPADYKAGDPVGEFKYSVNDGTTSVEGKVTLGVTPVNDAPDANDDFGVITGLKGNYYGYREGVDGGNLGNLAGVTAFIAGRTPSTTFTATELNYGNGVSNNLGSDQQLQKFLGADAGSLNTDPANTSDAIIEMSGQISLNAGTYQFRVTADDGYSIVIDGKVVAEFNGNQSPTARESATFTITESGAHNIQIIYWDQGGQAQLKVELRPEGGNYSVVGGAQLSQAGSDLLTTNEDQALVIEPSTLLGNDTDVDGDTLSIVSVQDAVNGSVALVNGKVVFTPAPDFNGTGSFTYTISDGNGKFDTATVTVGVKPVNDAPIVDNQSLTVDEKSVGTPLGLQAPTDIDGNPLTITVTGLPTLGSVTLANGSTVSNGQTLTSAQLQGLKYNAPADYKAGDSVGNFTYSVNDGSVSVNGSVTLAVNPINDLPVLNNPSVSVDEDQSLATQLDVSDVDGDSVSYTLKTSTTHGTLVFDNATGQYTYTPSANYNGSDSFTVTLDDGKGGVIDAVVSITVNPVNDVPTSSPVNLITVEDNAVTAKVYANDVDGDTLTYSIANGDAPQHGTVTLQADGTFTYTPAKDYNGSDAFTVTIDDGKGGVTTSLVSITVQPFNDAPETTNQTKVTDEDQSVSGQIIATDVDGDKLSYVIQSGVAHGSILLNTVTGAYTYTPNKDFNGTDSFTIRVYDPKGGYADSVVTVTVNPVNDAPIAKPQFLNTVEDNAVTAQIDARDVDGDRLTYSIADGNGPQHGTVTFDGNGYYTYTPAKDYNGTDAFTITIDDGNGGIATSLVSINVQPFNDAPETTNQTKVTDEDQSVSGQIVATDVDGDKLSYVIQSGVAHGSILLNTVTGAYTYTPNKDFNGTDSFTIRVYDPKGGYADSVVTITVNPVNDAPTSGPQFLTTDEDTPVDGRVSARDVDGDTLTYSIANGNGPQHGTVVMNANGTYTYQPAKDFHGTDSFTVTIDDGNGGTTTSLVSVIVNAINDAPIAPNSSVSVNEDGTLNSSIPATDAEGDSLTYAIKTGTSNGTLVLNPNTGEYTYKPNGDYNGQDSFVVTVSDGKGGVTDTLVSITVNPVNDAPAASDDSTTTREDTSVTIDVLANDHDIDGDTLSITGASAQHGTVSVVDGKLVYTPTGNYSGADTISYSITDGKGGNSSATVQVSIQAVADAPNLSVQTPAGTPHATGLTLQSWNGLALGNSGNGAAPATLKATIDAAGTPASSTSANDAHLDNVNAGVANKFSGLIYLQAGETYTFSGVGDDSVLVSVGGTTVASATWNGNSGQFSGSFTAQQSGYYTLDIYQHNQSGPGNLDVNVKVGNGAVQDLSTANALLYRNTSDLNQDGVRVSELHGSDGKGYYQVYGYNEGAEDSSIPLSHLTASLNDTDGSESLAISISQIPQGATLSDGVHSFTATTGATSTDISSWNLGNLSITPPANYNGTFDLKITATATEGANGDHASTSLNLPVTVHAINDAPTSADNTVTTDEDTSRSFTSADFTFNDVDAGDSLKAIRINSLPASGNLSLGNEAVTIGMIITAAQIASLVYTPAANASGNSSFSFSVQDQSGAFSTTPNTMIIQVAAVDDAPGLSNTTVSFAENIASGSTIANLNDRFTGTDQDRDGEPLLYSITGGNDAGLFAINSSTGVITLASGKSLDYETATQHQLQVTATDGKTPATATVTINVTNVNDNGVVISDSDSAANTVAENAANGTSVGLTVLGKDGDVGATITQYELTDNAGGRFAINASTGVVTVADGSKLDYENATSHNITVKVTSSDGSTNTQVFTINLSNVNDNGVVITDANPAANTVAENAANGTTVGLTVQGTDADAGATVTQYELTDNAGGRFAINASTGVVTVADGSKLDYENARSHNITVKATSSDGSSSTQVFTINLSNVNDNGVVISDTNSAANQVNENAATGTTVGLTVRGVDGDAGATVTLYELIDNAGGRFTINATSGVVSVADGSKLDYESATSHDIVVRATSSDGSTATQTFTIQVNNVNEAPAVVSGANVTGTEDNNYVFAWNDFRVSDVDANSNLSIKIENLPGEGRLQQLVNGNWSNVTPNTTVSKSVIDAGGLRFVPDANKSGHDSFSSNGVGMNKQTYAEFKYSGSDGTLTTASSTMSIDITPVADVPTLSVKSAAASKLFTTTWESAPNSDNTSQDVAGPTFENWTLVTSGDKRGGGTNVFEVWANNDRMENQAGDMITVKLPGTGNNDALELNDAGGSMSQTLGITRNVTTEVGKVYDLSMDYAGRLGFDTTFTKIAVYLGSTLVGEYGSTSSQTSLNWENIHFSFVGTGKNEALIIKLAGSSTDASGRGALIDNITLSSSQGVVAGDGGVSGKTSIALANYISGALTDTDGSESLRYDLSSLPAGASIVVGNSTLAAVNGVVSLTAAQLADAKLQVSGAVRGEIGLDIKAVSVEPNGSTANSASQHLTLKIVEGGVSHDSLTSNTITVADTSTPLSSGLTGEYWGYAESGSTRPNLTSLKLVEDYIESRSGNSTSLVGSNDNAAASSVNATFVANQIDYGLKNGNTVFSDDLGDNRSVSSGNSIGNTTTTIQNNLYDFLTAAGTGNVSDLKAGGAGLGDTSDAIIRAHGFLDLVQGGTYDIRVTADDGYRLMIGGQVVAEANYIQSTTTKVFSGVGLSGDLQALELLYWDQGGAASLKVEFKLSGSADSSYKVLGAPGSGLDIFQAPGNGQELVQTDTGWALHTIGTTNGGDASDLINGSKYSDILNGGNGHDVLYGNGGHDLLNGGDGNDLLIGGVGNDTLIGGAGADTFMWKSGDFGNDVIKDFNAADGDRIDLSELLPDTANANNLLDYLKVDTTTNTLQVSTTGDVANHVDVTIKLEGVNLSQYGSTSSQIVNSLVAGADPLVKTEHH
ncbi:MAG: retention module-containing protein [Pseudomonas sp.]|uniref:retention module-containing protein n=1 Tax=Pseudomonas sp. TaxID=306 RepID=UPI003D0C5946